MDKKDTNENKSLIKSVGDILTNIFSISSNTSHATYGVTKDLFDTDKLLDKMSSIQQKNEDTVKKSIDGNNYANSKLNSFGLLMGGKDTSVKKDKNGNTITDNSPDTVMDIISSRKGIFQELRQQLLIQNKFQETIAEYEMLRRAIPEVNRVINLLINNVIVPDVITTNTFNLKYNIDKIAEKELAKRIREKYELDKKIRVIVENYFILGAEYITVIPYKAVIAAIKSRNAIGSNSERSKIIKESALGDYNISGSNQILTESTFLDMMEDSMKKKFKEQESYQINHMSEFKKFEDSINAHINGMKVYKSNKSLVYDEAMVETIMNEDEFMFESSFEEFLGKDNLKLGMKSSGKTVDDGVVDAKSEYDDLNIRGCIIERLDPSRVYPIKMHDTIVAYVYIEERRDEALQYNLQNHMKNSFSFYRSNACGADGSNEFMMKQIEDRIITTIGSKVLCSLSPQFLQANFKDMDIFYEFLRDNDLHKQQHDIILLHPDDVIEFKRTDGSIMKNAVFFLKLYLLLLLNNILTKVRKGSDRTMYYISNGLNNDIEGSVQEAIEAICQSEIRVSDIGSIQGVMGAIGSTVDLFVPQTSDGDHPISPEVIAGQQVDMDEDFLKWILKSIVLSFNLPSLVVDMTNEVEFAKSLSMANLDVAMSSALSQTEINPPLTKMLKQIMAYELELTDEEINSIQATLVPPRSMLMQNMSDLLNTIKDLATSMADINVLDDDDKYKKLFIKSFVRKNLNYDWDSIDDMMKEDKKDKVKLDLEDEAQTGDIDTSDLEDDASGDMGGY